LVGGRLANKFWMPAGLYNPGERENPWLDRDYNSALNHLKNGLNLLPAERRESTPAEIVQQSQKQESHG
jgi:hypothetical protein